MFEDWVDVTDFFLVLAVAMSEKGIAVIYPAKFKGIKRCFQIQVV